MKSVGDFCAQNLDNLMPYHYNKRKMRSAYHALQSYINIQETTDISLGEVMKFVANPKDRTEVFHNVLYRISQQLTVNAKETFNELVCIRKIGKLYLNQPVYMPTPRELVWVGYNTKDTNHRIMANGLIRKIN